MDNLTKLENESIYIIREAYSQFKKVALLYSVGKDSTTLLWLCRKAFLGKIPFPVMHLDTTYKFPEIYEFRDKYAKEWGLNLIVAKNEESIAKGMGPDKGTKLQCCNELKTDNLKKAIAQYGFRALYLAIRRDEHGIRSKERFFCFPKGTPVYGQELKKIEDIKEGDLVYTHLSSLRKVQGVCSRGYQGKVLSIAPRLGLPIQMTPNHVVLAKVRTSVKKIIQVRLKGFDGKTRLVDLPIEGRRRIAWVQAKDLKKGDCLLIPRLAKKSQDRQKFPKFIYIDKVIGQLPGLQWDKEKSSWKSAHKNAPLIRRSLPVEPDIMRVFGYYTAEGSANSLTNQFEFAFHGREEHLANDILATIQKYFGVEGRIIKKGSTSLRVVFSSKTLMLLFMTLCGKGARNKKFPYFFMRLTDSRLRELVKGCWLGDGCKERYSTVSGTLARQMRMAMLRFGILTSLKHYSDGRYIITVAGLSKEKFKRIFGFECEVAYSGRFKLKSVKEIKELHSTSLSAFDFGKSRAGGFWVPIENIKEDDYKGLVYDLSVEGDSSYVVDGVAVHNSPRENISFQWNYKDQPPELWDQYKTKAKDEEHLRIHPMLGWREIDIWEYIRRENIPMVSLYFAKDGKRYRSIGCAPCCSPIDSSADTLDKIIEELKANPTSERAGRAQDKENSYTMQKLRSLGYM